MVVLDPVKPGGPFEVMAQQTLGRMNSTLRIHNVLFGDVWLCSGQSNLKMTVSQVICRISAMIINVGDNEEEAAKGKEGCFCLVSTYHVSRSVLRFPCISLIYQL